MCDSVKLLSGDVAKTLVYAPHSHALWNLFVMMCQRIALSTHTHTIALLVSTPERALSALVVGQKTILSTR